MPKCYRNYDCEIKLLHFNIEDIYNLQNVEFPNNFKKLLSPIPKVHILPVYPDHSR